MPSVVWSTLTNPEKMKQWMGDDEMKPEIATDWKAGSSITINGFHHTKFENKGVVKEFIPEKILRYTHLSSVSRLPDLPESYSIIDFRLNYRDNQTLLLLTIENFPTESIRKHLEFYWTTTLEILKNQIEQVK